MKKILQAAAFILVLSQVAMATTWYTSKSGNDSNPGTIGSPFLTITKGESVMVEGDLLLVRQGTYAEGIGGNYNSSPHGSGFDAAHAITITPFPGEVVTVLGMGWNSNAYPASRDFYWVVDGFNVTNSNAASDCVGTLTADHIRISNSEIHDCGHSGLQPHSSHMELINDNVHDNGLVIPCFGGTDVPWHGLYWVGANLLVDGGSYYHNAGYGIQDFDQGGFSNDNNVIRNARIYDNGVIPTCNGGGIIMSSGTGQYLYNNLIYNNKFNGLDLANCLSCFVINNSFSLNQGTQLYVRNTVDGYTVQNNIAASQQYDSGNGTASNNLFTTASYTNAAAGDLTIPITSTACGFALNSYGVPVGLNTDFAGSARSPTLAWAAGAYNCGGIVTPMFMRTQPGVRCSLAAVSSTTISCSLGNNPTAGDLVTMGGEFYDATMTAPTVVSVLDGNSNPYTVEPHNSGNTNVDSAGYVFQGYTASAPANANKTVTITYSKPLQYGSMYLMDFTPPTGLTTLDNGAYAGASNGPITTPTISVATSHDLLVNTVGATTSAGSPTGVWTANEGGTADGSNSAYVLDRATNLAVAYPGDAAQPYNAVGMSFRSCTATQLVYTGQPLSALVNATIGTITVAIRDAGGLTCTTATTSVTLSRNASATWNGMVGTLTATPVNGIVTFTGIVITPTTGSGSIDASALGLTTATSNSITISAGASICGVSPISGAQGQTLTVIVTGCGTSWVNVTSVGSFSGTGITVNSTSISGQAATLSVTIASNATISTRNVIITTGAVVDTSLNAFTVNPIPAITGGAGIRARILTR